MTPGMICEVLRPRQVPAVDAACANEDHVFDAVKDISSVTVTLYPPDLVIIVRMIDERHALIRYAGTTLGVMRVDNLKQSAVQQW